MSSGALPTRGVILATSIAGGLLALGSTSVSCIIPDHGIISLVDCGARWCADAPFATALSVNDDSTQVQEAKPDGSVGWVTVCQCMTPHQDTVLQAGIPTMEHDNLRAELMAATRLRCLEVALDNNLDPDPPFPESEKLDPTCSEAVTEIFRDGCCTLPHTQCGGQTSCEGGATGSGGEPEPTDGESADGSTGEMASLEPYYDEITCEGDHCIIGVPLIEAALHNPEAVLAEGTSLRFDATPPAATGLVLHGVEPEGLSWRLGLREGDLVLAVDELGLRDEAALWAAAARAQERTEVTLVVLRDGVTLQLHLVRGSVE